MPDKFIITRSNQRFVNDKIVSGKSSTMRVHSYLPFITYASAYWLSIILFKHGMLSFVVCEFFMLTCLREYIYWTMQRNDNFSFTLLLSKQLFHRMSVNTSGPLQTWRIRVPKYDFTKTVTKSTQKRSVQYRKWSLTANDPQNGPQMILDRKWSSKSTANDPERKMGMTWTQVSGSSCRLY